MFRDLRREGGGVTKELRNDNLDFLELHWQPGLGKVRWNDRVNDGRGEEGRRHRHGGKVEEEKKEGGFMIHLLAPDTGSILAEPRQSAHISLQLSLSLSLSCSLSILISRPHSSLASTFVFSPEPALLTLLTSFLPNRQTAIPHLTWVFESCLLVSTLLRQNCRNSSFLFCYLHSKSFQCQVLCDKHITE